MTKSIAFNADTLLAATIAFYILAANSNDLKSALAEFDDSALADMTIDELNENELLFDLFIDESTNLDDITNPEFHYTDSFRDALIDAYATSRIRLA